MYSWLECQESNFKHTMVIFIYFLFNITVFFDEKAWKMTIVSSFKLLKISQTPEFFTTKTIMKFWSQKFQFFNSTFIILVNLMEIKRFWVFCEKFAKICSNSSKKLLQVRSFPFLFYKNSLSETQAISCHQHNNSTKRKKERNLFLPKLALLQARHWQVGKSQETENTFISCILILKMRALTADFIVDPFISFGFLRVRGLTK